MAMADEDLGVVEIQDNFYRDSFNKVVICIILTCIAIGLMIAIAIYLHYTKPIPTTFFVEKEWRVQPVVPVDQPYLAEPSMLQWVGEFLPKAFVFDFNHYNEQLEEAQQYFTANGWKVFLNHLNNYVSYNNVTTNKLFVTGRAGGAPSVIKEGLYPGGRYGWWVGMPVIIDFASYTQSNSRTLTIQVAVVRVSTLNNLNGVAIDNVIVTNATGS